MMRTYLKNILLTACCCAWFGTAGSNSDATLPSEEVCLITDRSLYISGEWIRISASVVAEDLSFVNDLSKILYVELINGNLERVLGRKFRIEDQQCSAELRIPEHLANGVYFLKSYTRQMRNRGPAGYCYNRLKIINPFSDTLAQVPRREETKLRLEKPASPGNEILLDIQTDRPVYNPGDSIFILFERGSGADSLRLACISVVPTLTCRPLTYKDSLEKNSFNLWYMPEWHGVSLSGTLTGRETGEPLANHRIDLSILDAKTEFMTAYTRQDGRFFFAFPDQTGEKTLFIAAAGNDIPPNTIRVDNDFSALNPDMPDGWFTMRLQELEKKALLLMARNYQISRAFSRIPEDDPQKIPGGDTVYFYGKPTEVMEMDEYIQMPVLEDYLNELPFMVKVRRSQGRKELRVLGSSPGLQVYDPLVLVDGVPVYDPEAVLSIPSGKISHVEIINETYIKGNLKCGGIVSVHSRGKDFAGIALPSSGIFLPYRLLGACEAQDGICSTFAKGMLHPGDDQAEPTLNPLPDTRNTLLWREDLRLPSGSAEIIGFRAGPTKGRYDVVLQGILRNGGRITQQISFTIQ